MGTTGRTDPIGPRSARIADLRRLIERRAHRQATGRFVLDGPVLLEEALLTGLVREVFADVAALATPGRLGAAVAQARSLGVTVTPVAAGVLGRVADPVTPQSVVTVLDRPAAATLDLVAGSGRSVLVVDALADPGNLGTLVRVAEAAGLAGVWCLGEATDPFGPKAVRASAGSVLRVPVAVEEDASSAVAALRADGCSVVGLRAGGIPFDRAALRPPVALVVGSEAHGISDVVTPLVDEWVGIPMHGGVESLNAGVAGAVVALEIARRERNGSGTPGAAR